MNKSTKKSLSAAFLGKAQSLVVAALIAFAGSAHADYLGTENLRIFPIPLDDILDGYNVGDQIQFVIEVTPRDTGSDEGNAAWSTFYIPPGAKVVAANYVTIGSNGSYVLAPADDVDDTYDGFGVRGDPNYGAGLGQGFVNEVQQDTGVFYSTDPRTQQRFAAGSNVDGFDQVSGTGVDQTFVYNEWDRDQVVAFGQGGALSGNGGKGNTPMVLGSPNKGTGSPVAGPDAYYTNDYNPALGGTFANQLTGTGPWQRIDTLGDKIGGSGAVTPAAVTGAVLNTSVPVTGGFVFTTDANGRPNNSLPLATNAVRIVHGARRLGDLERWSLTLELTDPALFLTELDAQRVCADSVPGDTTPAKDNNWRYYEVSRSCADLNSSAAIVKNIINPASASTVLNNQIITYEFKIYNLTPNPLINVIPRDQGITDVTLVPVGTAGCTAGSYNGTLSTGGAVAHTGIAGNIASWATIPSLAAGAVATFRVCGRATANFGGITRNRATADFNGCGTSPCLTSDAIVPVTNSISGTVYADVDGSGTLTNSEVGIAGVSISLYRDANNNGIYDAGTDVLVSNTLTSGDGSYEFVAVPNGDYIIVETDLTNYISTGDIDNTTLNCGAGNGCNTIGSGTNGTASSIAVDASTYLTNRNFFDRPPFPDVSIVKTASPTSVRKGQNLVYTLTATNSAGSVVNALSTVITDTLPAGLTWVSTQNSNGGGTCTVGNLAACNCTQPGENGTLVCQMGTINIGASKSITLTTTVD